MNALSQTFFIASYLWAGIGFFVLCFSLSSGIITILVELAVFGLPVTFAYRIRRGYMAKTLDRLKSAMGGINPSYLFSAPIDREAVAIDLQAKRIGFLIGDKVNTYAFNIVRSWTLRDFVDGKGNTGKRLEVAVKDIEKPLWEFTCISAKDMSSIYEILQQAINEGGVAVASN